MFIVVQPADLPRKIERPQSRTRGPADLDPVVPSSPASSAFAAAGVTRPTIMGLACLRPDGEFFASFDHRSGALVAQLDGVQADGLFATGQAETFALNGRRFKAWAAVPFAAAERWDDVLHDALAAAIERRDRGDRPSPSRRR